MAELLLLALVGVAVALAVAWPLLDARPAAEATLAPAIDPEREALEVRHRLALEALRDVEADHLAGSLDEESYATQRAEAEAQAVASRYALDATAPGPEAPPPSPQRLGLPAVIAGVLVLLLVAGYLAPAPVGLAERDARIERIRVLTDAINANSQDTAALAELADLYLAGGSSEDVTAALVSLVLLRNAAPESRDAHQRLVTLLIGAGEWRQAEAATDLMAEVVGEDDREIPFFRGFIARGLGESAEAVRQFERFLRIAPDDPRAAMVRGLRDAEAAQPG
jgi:tetratricopeptide (TPR) repeat protein